jgi:hypothetical protein
MRVLIFGSRDWADQFPIWCVLNGYASDGFGVAVIEGEGDGADKIAKEWATLNGQPLNPYPADWAGPCDPDICQPRHRRPRRSGGTYCPAAGPRRNQRQLDEGKPDVGWGFVTKRLELSTGSFDMATRLWKAQIPCYIVTAGSVATP